MTGLFILWTVTIDRDDEDRVAFYPTEREARGAAQFYVRDGEPAEIKPFTVDGTTQAALARTLNKVYRRDF
jgi:hypothetical protein